MNLGASAGADARAGKWRRWFGLSYAIPISLLFVAGLGTWWHLWGRPYAHFLWLARNAEYATVPEDAVGVRRSEVSQDGIRIFMKWEFSTEMGWPEYGPWVHERLVGAGYRLKVEGPRNMVFLHTFPGDQTTVTIERNALSGQTTVRFHAVPW